MEGASFWGRRQIPTPRGGLPARKEVPCGDVEPSSQGSLHEHFILHKDKALALYLVTGFRHHEVYKCAVGTV